VLKTPADIIQFICSSVELAYMMWKL